MGVRMELYYKKAIEEYEKSAKRYPDYIN